MRGAERAVKHRTDQEMPGNIEHFLPVRAQLIVRQTRLDDNNFKKQRPDQGSGCNFCYPMGAQQRYGKATPALLPAALHASPAKGRSLHRPCGLQPADDVSA